MRNAIARNLGVIACKTNAHVLVLDEQNAHLELYVGITPIRMHLFAHIKYATFNIEAFAHDQEVVLRNARHQKPWKGRANGQGRKRKELIALFETIALIELTEVFKVDIHKVHVTSTTIRRMYVVRRIQAKVRHSRQIAELIIFQVRYMVTWHERSFRNASDVKSEIVLTVTCLRQKEKT